MYLSAVKPFLESYGPYVGLLLKYRCLKTKAVVQSSQKFLRPNQNGAGVEDSSYTAYTDKNIIDFYGGSES